MPTIVTLWIEGKPKLYAGRAEVLCRGPTFLLKMAYSDIKAQVLCRDIGSRYHHFCISSELNDQAVTFWPYQFWLLSVRQPEIISEGAKAQYMYLRFRVEKLEAEFPLITCGPWDVYKYRPLGVMGRYGEQSLDDCSRMMEK